ncbi:hypothetical protein ACVW0K_007309 [Streptomyces filamentosus]
MKKITALAAAAAILGSLTLTDTATAASTKRLWAQESVRIRATPNVQSAALGLLPKGASGASPVNKNGAYKRYFSGVHNACGSKGYIHDNQWNKITYRGVTGYVPEPCMVPFKP